MPEEMPRPLPMPGRRRASGRLVSSVVAGALLVGSALLPVAVGAPASAATTPAAPAATQINGLVWLDLDGDGVNDASEKGFVGAVVTLRDAAGAVVGTKTTAADGWYSFTGLDSARTYSLSVTRSTTTYPDPSNWVISAAPGPNGTYVGTDNDAVPAADRRVGLVAAAVPGSSYDIAIRPRPELSLGRFGPGVIDGTAPFNTLGGCASTGAQGQPGDDCGQSNSQIRTGDTLTTVWSVTSDNYEPGTSAWGDVVFEQTIVPSGGAVASFVSIPVGCQPPPAGTGGTGSPASAILTNYPTAGQTTLRCNLGQFPEGGQKSLTTSMRVSGLSPNGSSLTTTQRVYAGATGDRAIPAATDPVGPIAASARPAHDLVKLNFRNQDAATRCVDTDGNPATPCVNLAGYHTYFIIRITQEQKVGVEAVKQPITFQDSLTATKADGVTPYAPEFYITDCQPNPSTWGDVVFGKLGMQTTLAGYPAANATDSGTCTFTRSAPADNTSQYSFSITGADLSGARFPTKTYGGADLSAGPFINVEQRVQVFIPFRTIDSADGTVDGAGAIKLSNTYRGFDPDGISGASNYGAGYEPGYCPPGDGACALINGQRGNNIVGPVEFRVTTTGTMSKYMTYRLDNWVNYTFAPASSAGHDGAGVLEPRDSGGAMVNFLNNGASPLVNPGLCDIFDNTVYRLTTADKTNLNNAYSLPASTAAATRAYVTRYNGLDPNYGSAFSQAWPSNWRVEYGTIPIAGDNPLYNAARVGVTGVVNSSLFPGLDTYNTATGRYEGVWTGQQAARCTDTAPTGGWFTDPTAVPGGIGAVNAVRAVAVDPTFALQPSAYARLVVPLQARSTFAGGPFDGQVIPAGTVFANYSSVRSASLAWSGGPLGAWRAPAYKPSPETADTDGDRITLVRFSTKLQKHTLTPATDVGGTASTLAGNQIVWELIPAVTATIVPSSEIAKNVTITDVLPPNTTYSASCTAALNNNPATATILPISVEADTGRTGPQTGYTRLTYSLGDVPANAAIPRIRICTDTDPLSPNGTSVTNYSELKAQDDVTALTNRSDDHTIRLEQSGAMQIGKSVDRRLDPLNDTQVYTMEYANFASAFTMKAPTFIDVFPWNGDGSGSLSERDPASSYTGSLTLSALPTVTFKNGTVPGATDPYPAIGTFYYTKDAPATVNYNPDANTSTWCATTNGTTWTPQAPATAADCPATLANVTAVKFVSNYDLEKDGNPRQGQRITIALQATNNAPGDKYTNRATVDSASLPAAQFLRSNNVTVEVPSFNLGDLVFGDLNRNGVYDAAADVKAPEGVAIQLYRSGQTAGVDAPLATTTTNAAGRYQFTKLGQGDYYVVIPASEFAGGGKLAGWALNPNGLEADPNTDRNENVDHQAVALRGNDSAGGVRSSGTLTLSATVPASALLPPVGNEPLGDNLGNLPTSVSDDFTNYTLDLGLLPPINPRIALVKTTNGQDANAAPGPMIGVGGAVTWRYEARNPGDRPLVGVTVVDDAGTASDPADDWTMTKSSGYVSGDTDGDGALDPGEVWVFQHTGTAVAGQYANGSTVTAKPADNANQAISGIDAITASDPSHYYGVTNGLMLKKFTNGADADAAPGPLVGLGSTVTWTYQVTNSGNTPLTVTVTDDRIVDDSTIDCGNHTNLVDIPAGESVTCSATGTATAGQYANTGTAAASAPATVNPDGSTTPGVRLSASDPSHYFGALPAITVVKKIDDDDANTAPGLAVATPGTLRVTFEVTNSGNVPLDPVVVTDSDLAASDIVCPTTSLGVGASMTCLATLAAPAAGVQHSDTATVTGQPPALADGTQPAPVADTDDAHAWGKPSPAITIVKYLNGADANTAPGPEIVTGDTVNVSFLVTNTGNTRLDPVVVTDSVVSGISCPKTALDPAESMTCTASFTAPAASTQHTNTGTATGTPVLADSTPLIDLATGKPLAPVKDTDPAFAKAVAPGMHVVKRINGADANTAPGVLVAPGSTMQIEFVVFNNGTTPLREVQVTDDVVTGAIVCPATVLAVGASMTCTASHPAPAAGVQHTDTARARATPLVNGQPVASITDTDPANATTAQPGISVVKKINADDAQTAPGASVPVGTPMAITFEVTNTGNTSLVNVGVSDDVVPAAAISCPASVLASGATMTCTAQWAAPAAGATHADLATATGTPAHPDGSAIVDPSTGAAMQPVTDDDPAHAYAAAAPGLSIAKAINGDAADAAPGVVVGAGSTMNIAIVVTNTGTVMLSPVHVTDTDAVVTCPADRLEPAASMECTATLAAPEVGGTHVDTASATGTPTLADGTTPALGSDGTPLQPVTKTDDAHAYVPSTTGVTVVKSINGDDANTAPGPWVIPGSAMQIAIVVTNTGSSHVANVKVTDSDLTAVGCPGAAPATPDVIPLLGPAGSATASVTCTGSLTAPAANATHEDTAHATGTPTLADGTTPALGADGKPLAPPEASDLAHALGAAPAVTVVKKIDGDDANAAPGVSVGVGSTMTVTFEVTNTGNTVLTELQVADAPAIASGITCPVTTLAVGAGTVCTAEIPAPAAGDAHVDTATVTGTPAHPDGTPIVDPVTGAPMAKVIDDDPAHAWTPGDPAITIRKSINGDDANTAPGVAVPAGTAMNVGFLVTNTGNVTLAQVSVTDSVATNISCPRQTLAPSAEMTCTATIPAPAPGHTHADTATVTGTPVASDGATPALGVDGQPLAAVRASDDAHAFVGATAGVTVTKYIDQADANEAPGVAVAPGEAMKVTFAVTNTGTSYLAQVAVTDTVATAITCPGGTADAPQVIGLLAPGASETCTASIPAPAVGDTHSDTASVTGKPSQADGVTPALGEDGKPLAEVGASDSAHAFTPAKPGIAVDKLIQGDTAASAPGVLVPFGTSIAVTFVVTNTGNVRLDHVTIQDDTINPVTCPQTMLEPGESVTCTATLPALGGGVRHQNTVTVTGDPVLQDGRPALGDTGQPATAPTASDTAYAHATTPDVLPQTGSGVEPPWVFGLLIVAGLVLIAVGRRRAT